MVHWIRSGDPRGAVHHPVGRGSADDVRFIPLKTMSQKVAVLLRAARAHSGFAPEVPVSGVDLDVLDADDFLPLVRSDRVPDGHVVRGQVKFVGTWNRVTLRNGSARVGTGSSSRWKIVRWVAHRTASGSASISAHDRPGKRIRRSLTP